MRKIRQPQQIDFQKHNKRINKPTGIRNFRNNASLSEPCHSPLAKSSLPHTSNPASRQCIGKSISAISHAILKKQTSCRNVSMVPYHFSPIANVPSTTRATQFVLKIHMPRSRILCRQACFPSCGPKKHYGICNEVVKE